jgi:3alpha(or 20beta)-hydroxysteroid dehydrogenase
VWDVTARLAGLRALVTGGSRGIGEAISSAFVQEGATVLIGSRDAEAGRAVVARLGSLAAWESLDIRDEFGWKRLLAQSDPFDVLVNNAGGLQHPRALLDLTLAQWQEELDTNLTGAFLGMRAVLPGMLARGRGSIVNIGSISGIRAQGDGAGYQAAKGGLRLLTRHAAFTYAARGVRVNLISPGSIATRSVAAEPVERTRPFIERTPMQRSGSPHEVAMMAVFLASDESSFVTGGEYAVDGGYVL